MAEGNQADAAGKTRMATMATLTGLSDEAYDFAEVLRLALAGLQLEESCVEAVQRLSLHLCVVCSDVAEMARDLYEQSKDVAQQRA